MSQAPDIRVRLSPEGQKEVINALRQVAAEAVALKRKTESLSEAQQIALNKTLVSRARLAKLTDAQAAGQIVSPAAIKNIDSASVSLLSMSRLIPTLGFAAAATGLAEFVRHAANFNDEIGKAAQRTGSSAENFSVLAFAAKTADVEVGDLETGIQRMVVSLADLRKGSLAQVDAFDQIGLSAQDFAGKDGAQSFDLIAEKLSRLTDETKKVEVARAIFGRGGAQLIPLLNDLGTKGFGKVREEAARLGLVISTDLANASQAANDSLKLLGEQTKGLAVQFISGLAPAVTQTMTQFQEDTGGKGAEGMKTFGVAAGKALGFIINGFKIVASVVGDSIGIIGDGAGAIAAVIGAAIRGEFSLIPTIVKDSNDKIKAQLSDLGKSVQEGLGKSIFDLVAEPPAINVKVKAVVDTGSADEASSTIQKQIEEKLSQLSKKVGTDEFQNLQKLSDKRQQLAEDEIKNQQALAEARAAGAGRGLAAEIVASQATEAAIRARVELARQGFQTETQLAQAKAAALNAAVDSEVKNVNSRAQLKTEIAKRADAESLASAQNYYSKLLALNTEWLNRYKAASDAIKAIDRERQDNQTNLAKTIRDIDLAGATEAEKFSAKKREALDLEEQQKKAIAAGDIERSRQTLQEGLAAARELAALGAPRLGKDFAEEFTARQDAFLAKQKQAQEAEKATAKEAIQSLAVQFDELKKKIADFQTSGLTDVALKLKLDQPEFEKLIATITEQLAQKTFAINVAPNVSGGGGSAPGFAAGGPLLGWSPHPKADNLLFLGTANEFVQPVAAHRFYGTEFMERIRTLQFPKFADGGVVGGGGVAPGAPAGQVVHLDLSLNKKALGRVSGSRDAVRNLVAMLNEVAKGT